MSLEEIIYYFQQETQRINRKMEDGRREWASTIRKLISPIYEELSSQTIIDLKEHENTIILTSDMEFQESQEKGSTNIVEKGIEIQQMRPQYQIVQVNEFNEQSPNAVTSPSFLNQHSPSPPFLNQYFFDSYCLIPVSEINFIILENFEFHDKNNLRMVTGF